MDRNIKKFRFFKYIENYDVYDAEEDETDKILYTSTAVDRNKKKFIFPTCVNFRVGSGSGPVS